ncbi:MAG: hypothetical protein J1E33_03640 [Alistipes sp.]|nr:hypothetical protein [Alistipes sp.]
MIGAFIEVVGGTVLIVLLIALIAAIFVGIVIGFFAFVIAPILAILCCIFGWDKPEKKEKPTEENI